jgi:hypothetical protein
VVIVTEWLFSAKKKFYNTRSDTKRRVINFLKLTMPTLGTFYRSFVEIYEIFEGKIDKNFVTLRGIEKPNTHRK